MTNSIITETGRKINVMQGKTGRKTVSPCIKNVFTHTKTVAPLTVKSLDKTETVFARTEKGLDETETVLPLTEMTGEILSDIGRDGKERPWARHKSESVQLVELFEIARQHDESIITKTRLQGLRDCASFTAWFRDAEQRQKLKTANFCRLRLCPMCNWRRSLKLFGQVSRITDRILQDAPSTRFIFVTLTVRNCEAAELTGMLDRMNKGFQLLTQKKQTFMPAARLKSTLIGYLKAIEITYNQQENTYHPHLHCIFAVKAGYFRGSGYIKKSEYQGLWRQALKLDYDPIVHVEIIKNGTSKAVAEVAKYPTKTADLLSVDDKDQAARSVAVLHKTLKGRRLITFGGVFAQAKKELKLEDVDSENVDLLHVDQDDEKINPVEVVLYRYNARYGVYIC
jgi:plasmid rolling circle replication initiator protein Rep